MKKIFCKAVSSVLAAVLLVSAMATGVFAAGTAVGKVDSGARDITETVAVKTFEKALVKAQDAGKDHVTIKFSNREYISFTAMNAVKRRAKAAGVTVTIQVDTVVDSEVQSRLYIDPYKPSKGVSLSSAYGTTAVNSKKEQLQKKYGNALEVVHMSQSGNYGMEVELALKINLEGMDTDNLAFYSYDSDKKKLTRIENLDYTITSDGFVRFKTKQAGDIVISDGPLVTKG